MAAFIVATVTNADPVKFGAYVKAIAGLAESFGGDYLVRGKAAEVFEGDVDPDELVVVIRFPDAEAARAYMTSDRYRQGRKLREGGGDLRTRLIPGPV